MGNLGAERYTDMNTDNLHTMENDEHYFVALANNALATSDVRTARRFAAQYDTVHHGESRLHRLARRFHLAS